MLKTPKSYRYVQNICYRYRTDYFLTLLEPQSRLGDNASQIPSTSSPKRDCGSNRVQVRIGIVPIQFFVIIGIASITFFVIDSYRFLTAVLQYYQLYRIDHFKKKYCRYRIDLFQFVGIVLRHCSYRSRFRCRYPNTTHIISCARRQKINSDLYFQYEQIKLKPRSIYLIVSVTLQLLGYGLDHPPVFSIECFSNGAA